MFYVQFWFAQLLRESSFFCGVCFTIFSERL